MRAETRIELNVARIPAGFLIRGALRDDLAHPLVNREVALRITALSEGRTETSSIETRLDTDARGQFIVDQALPLSRYQVRVFFEGDANYLGIAVAQDIDLTRVPVQLSIDLPDDARLNLDAPTHNLEIQSSSPRGGADLQLLIEDERGNLLAEAQTDAQGHATVVLESATLGPPSAGRLIVRTEGDTFRSSARTEIAIIRFRESTLALRLDRADTHPEDPIRATTILTDSAGPMVRETVGLYVDEQHIASGLTDSAGEFSSELTLDNPGPHEVYAIYIANAPGRSGVRSDTIRVEVSPIQPVEWRWLIVPLIGCAIGWWWLNYRDRRSRTAPNHSDPKRTFGIELGTPQRTGTLARVSGQVLDLEGGTLVSGCAVDLIGHDGSSVRAETNDLGQFSVEASAPGHYRITFDHPEYDPLSELVTTPHRGEYTGLTVRLRHLRGRVLEAFGPVAEVLTSTGSDWPQATLREVSQKSPTVMRDATEALVARSEKAAYGRPPPTREEVADIESDAQATRALIETHRDRTSSLASDTDHTTPPRDR